MPETKTSVKEIISKLKYGTSQSKASHIIIVAEGDEIGRAANIADEVKKQLPGLDTKVTTLGHVQRGGAPTAADRVLASRLGLGAVEGLIKGKSNVMAGVINRTLCYTAFHETITKRKPLNKELIRMIEILNGRKYKEAGKEVL
jgi:6-phosphofructokinase 1